MLKLPKDKKIEFKRRLVDAEPFETLAWQTVLRESGEDASLPWEGYVSRQLLNTAGDPTNLQHYDILFKVRFNRLDEYSLAIAIADKRGSYRAGFTVGLVLIGNVFTLKSPTSLYRPLLVEWPTGTGQEYYADDEGNYSAPG